MSLDCIKIIKIKIWEHAFLKFRPEGMFANIINIESVLGIHLIYNILIGTITMSLRSNTGQGVVTTLDKLNGNILLEQGPGMTIVDNPTTNSIRLSTLSQAANLDTVLQNGDSSAEQSICYQMLQILYQQ